MLFLQADLGSLDGNIKPLESGLGHNKPTSTGWSLVEKKYVVILLKKVTILNLSSAIFLSMLLFKKDSSKHTPSLVEELKDSFGKIKVKRNLR